MRLHLLQESGIAPKPQSFQSRYREIGVPLQSFCLLRHGLRHIALLGISANQKDVRIPVVLKCEVLLAVSNDIIVMAKAEMSLTLPEDEPWNRGALRVKRDGLIEDRQRLFCAAAENQEPRPGTKRGIAIRIDTHRFRTGL